MVEVNKHSQNTGGIKHEAKSWLDKLTSRFNSSTKNARADIDANIKDLISSSAIDIDGDGKVTTTDTNLITEYIRGSRGAALEKITGGNSHATAKDMEAKLDALVKSKHLVVDGGADPGPRKPVGDPGPRKPVGDPGPREKQ